MRELQINDPVVPNSALDGSQADLIEDNEKIRDGIIFAYAQDIEMGIVKTLYGKRYVFVKADWLNPEFSPRSGTKVSFEVAGSLARKVTVAVRAPRS